MATNELAPVGAEEDLASGLAAGGTVGRSTARRTWGLVGQYLVLTVLALLVLGPLLLTVMQAVSPTAEYLRADAPLRPVGIEWKDRTWFSGGIFSVVVRTLVLLTYFTWLQQVAAGSAVRRQLPPWTPAPRFYAPALAYLTAFLLIWLAGLPDSDPVRIVLVVIAAAAGAVALWTVAAYLVPTFQGLVVKPGPVALGSALAGTVLLALLAGPTFESLRSADGRSQWWIVGTMAVVGATQVPGYLDRSRRGPAVTLLIAAVTGALAVGVAVAFVGPTVWTKSWGQYSLGEAMGRSLTMAVIITTLQVVTSIMAAYAFVFLRFPFKRVLFALFMATLLLPLEVTLVGNIETIRQLDWTNTMQALVLPFGATALGTFLIRQGFRGLPPEIQDATRLDGYGHLAFLTKFAVPLSRPVIASFTVISALGAWNQYLWPRSVITQNQFNTLQIQLRAVAAREVNNANEAVAAALVAAVPVVILLVLFQRQIIRGLTAGAVK